MAEATGQVGNMVEHPNQSQTNQVHEQMGHPVWLWNLDLEFKGTKVKKHFFGVVVRRAAEIHVADAMVEEALSGRRTKVRSELRFMFTFVL